ncbi:hypothetical protein [Flavobacterium coralii]|uniref:hypothetical protein n=1 Tax=Flavobacterium coralii TaxID=2838017 RepID=UPI000C3967CD|nr:hypothetical protein [Flavobacterium sp.]|tara:strand:- start:24289 stop:25161 length:873 start_codon:yes stop_codon:yes gene_type:complete
MKKTDTINLLLSASVLLLLSCNGAEDKLTVLGETGKDEISGTEYVNGVLWALEDSGNKDILYRIGEKGGIEQQLRLRGMKNKDWEDLTSDAEGNLYIGDFGNNDNDRKNLAIYKINRDSLDNDMTQPDYTVYFKYPDQKSFPPKKSEFLYDAEAFFEHNGNFYIFTKNRSARYDGSFKVYKVPNKAGSHTAVLAGTYTSCSAYRKCAITGADISPDGTVALLSSDKVWLIPGFSEVFKQEAMQQYELGHYSQKEGITFKDNNTLLIADEKEDGAGGLLYSVTITDLKAKR